LYAIRHFSHFLSRPAMLTDLDDATVSRLLMHRREHGGSARAVNCVRDRLLAVWNYAARKKLVETFPDIPPEPQPYRAPQAWTIAELAKLVKAAGKVRGHVGDVPARDWWPALILTAWCSAERISALMACKWSWLDGCGFLTVRGECRKGQRADIVRKLSAEALAALERIRSPARDLIFEWPKSPSSLWMGFRRIVKAAGLKPGRESGFHRLRRSAASHFCAAGGNPSALLGHADQRIVARYLDERITAPTQACDLLPSLTHKAHTS
jgi:integrase